MPSDTSEDPDGSAMRANEEAKDDSYNPGFSPVNPHANPVESALDRVASPPRGETLGPDDVLNSKRKLPDFASLNHPLHVKRARLDGESFGDSRDVPKTCLDRSRQLPAEIWHLVFTFVPPKGLARLMSVNKLFLAFLQPYHTANLPAYSSSSSHGTIRPLNPNAIWRGSRGRYMGRIPSPLNNKTELDMWRLVCTHSCQVCGFKGNLMPSHAIDQWHRGPGAKGVSPVFPFGVAVCGNCLVGKGVKEADILSSSSIPSCILSALAPAFITDERHVVPARLLKGAHSCSPHRVTKIFWSAQVEDIKQEYEAAKTLGSAATEEWIKGLEDRGRRAITGATRWEKWDLSSGVHLMRTSPIVGSLPSDSDKATRSSYRLSQSPGASLGPKAPARSQIPAVPKIKTITQNIKLTDNQRQDFDQIDAEPASPKAGSTSQSYKPLRDQQQPLEQLEIPGLAAITQANMSQLRLRTLQKRTKQEVAELKSKRRAELERRALLLDPPITPAVLAHVPSFLAALQIISPLDDSAWELLKPRLIAQREEAELKERELNNISRVPEDDTKAQEQSTTTPQETRKVSDKEWDEAQGPLRRRIADIADEIIQVNWNNGIKVRKKNAPQFAAEVLVNVRERFYAEITKDVAAVTAAGLTPVEDLPQGPWTRKLTLENMKWVFDFKIKPLTEMYRTELFLCNGCKGNSKYYGLEGVIQHYAAKHTANMSLGNIVVYWRAEWPEVPPFCPHPQHQASGQSSQPSSTVHLSSGPQPYPMYAEFTSRPSSIGYPAYSYGASLPQVSPSQAAPFPMSHALGPNAQSFWPSFPQPYFAQNRVPSSYSSVPVSGSALLYSNQPPAEYGGSSNPVPPPYYYNPYLDPLGQYTHQPPNDPSVSYRARLDTMIKVAREAWNLIEGISDLPPSVKVCVIVHRIAKTFQKDFAEAAPLPMLIEGLSNHKDMRPIRNTPGLACKACFMGHNVHERTDFSLPQLTNHFYQHHVEGLESQGLRPLDWRIDMILLPDISLLRGLQQVLKEIPPAYDLVAETLPWAFQEEQLDFSPIGQQSWPRPVSPHRDGVLELTDCPLDRPIPSDILKEETKVQNPSNQLSAAEDPHHHQLLYAQKPDAPSCQAPSRSPSYSPEPPNLVPTLRPASEVYTRQRRRGEKMEGRYPVESPDREFPRSDRHERLQAVMPNTNGSSPSGYKANSYARSGPSRDHPLGGNEWDPDYRDVEPHRYVSRERAPLGDIGRGRNQEDVRREIEPPEPVAEATPPRPARDFDIPYTRAPHFNGGQDEVIYLDTSGREVRREFRPVEARSKAARIMYHDGLGHNVHCWPVSRRHDEYSPLSYRDQEQRPKYESLSYHREPEHAVHRVHYDNTRTLPRPPSYELVKLHDPMGDYMMRAPIRRSEQEYWNYEREFPSPSYPFYDGFSTQRPTRTIEHGAHSRTSLQAPAHTNSRVGYKGYDSQYPVPGAEEPSNHQIGR